MPIGAYNCKKGSINGQKRPFLAILSCFFLLYCLLKLQNVSYHHTEQLLQAWSPHRCIIWLIITKKWPMKDQKWLVLAVSCNFWAIFGDYKPFEACMGTPCL